MLTKKTCGFFPELSPYIEVSKHNNNKLFFVIYMFQEYVCPNPFKIGRQVHKQE